MKNHLLVSLLGMLLLLLMSTIIHGQENETLSNSSSSSFCVTDSNLEPAIRLDNNQKVSTLHIRMPSFWCQGTIPNDFVFTIEPAVTTSNTTITTTTTTTTTTLYTIPTLFSPMLQVNQTNDETLVTILSQNTSFSTPGSFGVVIQVPVNDLQTIIVERSFFWDQNSIKIRIASGFTTLSRIVCQTLDGYPNDNQGIELDADITTTTSSIGVTLDLYHHGTFHILGNVSVLNVLQQQHSISSSTDDDDTKAAAVAVQIKGNVATGNITRPGTYSIFGNITGPIIVDTTTTTKSSNTSSSNNTNNTNDNDGAVATKGAVLITTSSCDNVTLLNGGEGGDDACNTVTAGTLANLMTTTNFFSLSCTVIACQETGITNINNISGGVNATTSSQQQQACFLSTKCPLSGRPDLVPNVAPTRAPTPAPTYGTSTATTTTATTSSRLLDLMVVLVVLLSSCLV